MGGIREIIDVLRDAIRALETSADNQCDWITICDRQIANKRGEKISDGKKRNASGVQDIAKLRGAMEQNQSSWKTKRGEITKNGGVKNLIWEKNKESYEIISTTFDTISGCFY